MTDKKLAEVADQIAELTKRLEASDALNESLNLKLVRTEAMAADVNVSSDSMDKITNADLPPVLYSRRQRCHS